MGLNICHCVSINLCRQTVRRVVMIPPIYIAHRATPQKQFRALRESAHFRFPLLAFNRALYARIFSAADLALPVGFRPVFFTTKRSSTASISRFVAFLRRSNSDHRNSTLLFAIAFCLSVVKFENRNRCEALYPRTCSP